MEKNTQQPAWWHARINGAHDAFFNDLPPDDAYDEGTLTALYTAPPAPRDLLMAFGEAVRSACYEAAMVRQSISGAKWERFTAGKCAEAVSMVNTAAIADRYASQVQPELPSFDDVIAVQRREVMADPSNAYMVGLHNGMTMMDANYRNSTDFECLTVQNQPEPVNQQTLAALNNAADALERAEFFEQATAARAAIAAAEAAQLLPSGPVMHTPSGFAFDEVIAAANPGDLVALTPQTASAQPVAVPDGWQLVPKEPTPEMLEAAWQHHGSVAYNELRPDSETDAERYRAMLSAAPKPEGGE